jgi:starch-binding outer membrane protein, SusD/RagB family
MKKNISKIWLLAFLAISSPSCKKFITKEIKGDYPASEFYKTQAQAILAINAAYQPLMFTNSNNNRLWVFGDVASDDAVKGGIAGDQADIELIDQFNITPINGNLEAMWALLYEGVTRCNLVLSNVPAISMDQALQSRILGEAKFLRAYYYFTLVNVFGDVPVILVPTAPEDLQIPQSPVSGIFAAVIEPDLKDAEVKLPDKYAGGDVGRVTNGAASALLTKAYIFQAKWSDAAAAAEKIINSNKYALNKFYSHNFNANFKNNNNPESIFEVQHLTGQTPQTGNQLNQYFAPQEEGGYFFNAPTQSFVDEFEVTPGGIPDPRLDYTVGRDSMPWFNGVLFSKDWSPATGYLTKKHQQPLSEISKALKGDASIDYIAIRYADVLLWYAEALNELGRPQDAIAPLNAVRRRARESYLYDNSLAGYPNIPPNLLPNVVYTNQPDVRAAIQHERRVELGFEFHRYFDIIRWGEIYAKNALHDRPNFNYSQHKHFPIPQSERDRNRALH